MSAKRLFEKLDKMELLDVGELVIPPPELVGFFVRWVRGLRNWKQSTLSDFAEVSVSTIERVERGEKVSDECLERIAQALGYGRGYFTSPRRRKSPQECSTDLDRVWGHLEAVSVKPLRTQAQVRKLLDTHAYLVHRPDVDEALDSEIESFVEWVDLASFIIKTPIEGEDPGDCSRRGLYSEILGCAQNLERRGVTVLSGIMNAPQDGLPDWKVAIFSITPKSRDPGAAKRRTVFVDRRCVALPPMNSPGIA